MIPKQKSLPIAIVLKQQPPQPTYLSKIKKMNNINMVKNLINY